jgi:AraC-like DNA-binding protein
MGNLDKSMIMIDIADADCRIEVAVAVEQVCDASWEWRHDPGKWEGDSSLLLWLVTGGNARLRSRFGEYQVHRGDFYLMPSLASEYHGTHDPNHPLEVIWAFFRILDTDGKNLPVQGIEGIPFQTKLTDPQFAEQLLKRMVLSSGHLRSLWLRVLLTEVRQQAMLRQATGNDRWMHELGQDIQAHPERYRKLDDMLRTCRVSKDHLIRLFRDYHGLTPVEFLIRSRLNQARALLAASSLSVKQIAVQLGYTDASAFSRQFKARVGISPRNFRENRQR